MKLEPHKARRAFTLIELLVVIAVISILAALIFPIAGAVKRAQIRSKARGEMAQLIMFIENYKSKLGFYPPDNPGFPVPNQLYYELLGTRLTNGPPEYYETLDGSARFDNVPATYQLGFGATTAIGGFVNAWKGGDEGTPAQRFASALKATQFLGVTNPTLTVLGSSADGPLMYQSPAGGKINPWRYVSSTPTNNSKTYDLWIDVTIGSKTNRICNWTEQALILP